jgi:DNA-binding beta-propeller fold protein YncE
MRRLLRGPWLAGVMGMTAVACGGSAVDSPPADAQVAPADAAVADRPVDAGPTGLPVLGGGTHRADAVQVRVVATIDQQLATPRDLAFHPTNPRQLWVTNFADNSITLLNNVGAADQDADRRTSSGSTHFMVHPSCLAFGAEGMLATAHEEHQRTQGAEGTPPDFMGPSLWQSNPDAFDGGHGSHIDMLHNSPDAVGIAWETANAYWVVDGAHRSLTRYDFHRPHAPGGTDHSDGEVRRYAAGEMGFVAGVSSHAVWDADRARLYVADTGNHRIVSLDPSTALATTRINPNYDGGRQNMMMGASTVTLFDGAPVGVMAPSGLELRGTTLYLTDNATSRIYAIGVDGQVIDWLDLSDSVRAGSLQGITLDGDGRIYVTDSVQSRILEISALTR